VEENPGLPGRLPLPEIPKAGQATGAPGYCFINFTGNCIPDLFLHILCVLWTKHKAGQTTGSPGVSLSFRVFSVFRG
jgi:hypothetical protein